MSTEKTKIDLIGTLIIGAIFSCVGAIGGIIGGNYLGSPNSVYVKELNGDERPDIVVKSHGNTYRP